MNAIIGVNAAVAGAEREVYMNAMNQAFFPGQLGDSLSIEQVQLTDLPAIVAIDAELTGISKPEIWYGYYSPAISGGHRNFMVARHNGEVVGYVVGEVRAWEFGSPPCGWLFAIGVRKEMRLAGIGTLLFGALQKDFQHQGAKSMRTMVHIDEHLLISFFRSHGMTAGPFIELELDIASSPSSA